MGMQKLKLAELISDVESTDEKYSRHKRHKKFVVESSDSSDNEIPLPPRKPKLATLSQDIVSPTPESNSSTASILESSTSLIHQRSTSGNY